MRGLAISSSSARWCARMMPLHWLVFMALTVPACERTPASAPPLPTSSEMAPTPRPAESAMSIPPASSAPLLEASSAPPPTNPMPAKARLEMAPAPTCGRKPGERIEQVTWAHGSGNATCDALETIWANVPHADRACHSDNECTVIVSDGNCIRLPLTKKAVTRVEYKTPPCGNPMSGACPGRVASPRCVSGCCKAD
jgi:hypothetical protein